MTEDMLPWPLKQGSLGSIWVSDLILSRAHTEQSFLGPLLCMEICGSYPLIPAQPSLTLLSPITIKPTLTPPHSDTLQ